MGYVNDNIERNNIQNYFNIFKYNMKFRKEYYIGLVNNDDTNEGYNIINKTGKRLFSG